MFRHEVKSELFYFIFFFWIDGSASGTGNWLQWRQTERLEEEEGTYLLLLFNGWTVSISTATLLSTVTLTFSNSNCSQFAVFPHNQNQPYWTLEDISTSSLVPHVTCLSLSFKFSQFLRLLSSICPLYQRWQLLPSVITSLVSQSPLSVFQFSNMIAHCLY